MEPALSKVVHDIDVCIWWCFRVVLSDQGIYQGVIYICYRRDLSFSIYWTYMWLGSGLALWDNIGSGFCISYNQGWVPKVSIYGIYFFQAIHFTVSFELEYCWSISYARVLPTRQQPCHLCQAGKRPKVHHRYDERTTKRETQTNDCRSVGTPLAPCTHVSMKPLALFSRDFLVIRTRFTAGIRSTPSLMSRLG